MGGGAQIVVTHKLCVDQTQIHQITSYIDTIKEFRCYEVKIGESEKAGTFLYFRLITFSL